MEATRAIPEINEDANLLILERLIELRKDYNSRVNDPDINGMYNVSDNDKAILKDINSVIKWVAAGGFE